MNNSSVSRTAHPSLKQNLGKNLMDGRNETEKEMKYLPMQITPFCC